MVLAWFLQGRAANFRHIALTARPLETAPDVAHWVMRHFAAWIRCFGVVPTRNVEEVPLYDRGKGDFLRWLGQGDVLVDDALENLRQAAELGLKTLAFPQPWNRSEHNVDELLREPTAMREEKKDRGCGLIKLSDYVTKFLAARGVKHVFMLTGGGCMHLVDSFGRQEGDGAGLLACMSRRWLSRPKPTRSMGTGLGAHW